MLRLGLRIGTSKLQKSQPSLKNGKLEYFRQKILDHLSKLEKEECNAVSKAFSDIETLLKKSFPVGTVRTWKGKKHIKVAPGDWRPKYDEHTRGAKMAISALKKKIAAAKDEHEMMQVCLANRDRFSDKNGYPLPFMQEFSKYVEEQKTVREEADSKKKLKEFIVSRIKDERKTLSSARSRYKKVKADVAERFAEGNLKKNEGMRLNHSILQAETNVKYHEKALDDLLKEAKQLGLDTEGKDKAGNEQKGQSGDENTRTRSDAMKGNKNAYKGGEDTASEAVVRKFIDTALNDRNQKGRVKLGNISNDAQSRIKDVIGETGVSDIYTTMDDVRHAHQEKHKIDPDDFQKAVEVINTSTDIELSNKRHQDNDVLIFKKDIDGEITFLTEVRVGRGRLNVFDCWRQKKSRKRSNAASGQMSEMPPGAYAQNDSSADTSNISQSEKKSSGFSEIQKKYQAAKAITGDDDEIQIGKETLAGKWKLVEADTPTASHDESTFHKTEGFPTNEDGSTINDRDYGHDKAAQEAVLEIAADFDGRAVKVDSPVVVTNDGVVISGNNRTMSSKIAAKKGTDKAYIEALKKRAKKFGLTEAQVGEFKHPRVVFEVEQKGAYTTEQFAQFNQSGKKEMGPTEMAVKVSKMIKTETVKTIAEKIGEFDTLGELYANRSAVQHIFSAFKGSGLIGEFEIAKYIETGNITEDGKNFVETALLGSVMNENNIRGLNRPGCKSIRAMLVRAITPLIENKSMGGYSITRELNEAADIAMQTAIEKDKFRNVEEFSKQQQMFEKLDPVSVALAKKLEGTQKAFAEFMLNMNGSLKIAANGEADIFLGDIESKEEILKRFLPIKKAVADVINSIRGLFDYRR